MFKLHLVAAECTGVSLQTSKPPFNLPVVILYCFTYVI